MLRLCILSTQTFNLRISSNYRAHKLSNYRTSLKLQVTYQSIDKWPVAKAVGFVTCFKHKQTYFYKGQPLTKILVSSSYTGIQTIHIELEDLHSNLVMFLDAYGSPREVTPGTLHEYPYDLVRDKTCDSDCQYSLYSRLSMVSCC